MVLMKKVLSFNKEVKNKILINIVNKMKSMMVVKHSLMLSNKVQNFTKKFMMENFLRLLIVLIKMEMEP
jgi:hypothetical protein